MNIHYQELAERIRGGIRDLDRVTKRALQAWSQVGQTSGETGVYLDSVALNLHGFYSGLERLFELISRHVDRNLPVGETWHRDLLQQMTHDSPAVRPAVISRKNGATLDEFRRFRHLVRNVYTTNLVPDKMAGLMVALPELWPGIQDELLAFADFLEALAEENEIPDD